MGRRPMEVSGVVYLSDSVGSPPGLTKSARKPTRSTPRSARYRKAERLPKEDGALRRMKKTNVLGSAMRGAGARVAPEVQGLRQFQRWRPRLLLCSNHAQAAGGSKRIMLHLKETRRQLKALAVEQGRS